jgi:hypothetical protein
MTPTKVTGLRFTDDERSLLDRAALTVPMSTTEWCRRHLIRQAELALGIDQVTPAPVDAPIAPDSPRAGKTSPTVNAPPKVPRTTSRATRPAEVTPRFRNEKTGHL